MKFSPTAWFRRTLCVAFLPAMTGCLTNEIWTPVFQTRADHPAIAGLVRNYPSRGDQAIVVTYRARGDWNDVNLVVPLDPAGNPVSPFAPVGPAFVVKYYDSYYPEPVAGRLSTAHLTAIFGTGQTIGPDRGGLAKHLTAVDFFPVANYETSRSNGQPAHPGTAWVLAFKTDDAGQIVPVSVDWQEGQKGPIRLPAGTRLLLVPSSVDRPGGDRTMNVVDAVLLTPVTVGADAVLIGSGLTVTLVMAPFLIPIYAVQVATHPATQPATQPTATTMPATEPAPTGPVTVPVEIGSPLP